jgi:YggT family protein
MGNPLHTLLLIYIFILWARVILSFVPLVKPGWSPGPGIKPVFDVVYALTDPPINALRKVVPQPFGFPLDLAFLVWFLIIYVAYSVT